MSSVPRATHKEILKILRRIEENQILENADERIRKLEKRLDVEIGNREELETRMRKWSEYWNVNFEITPRYEKKPVEKEK